MTESEMANIDWCSVKEADVSEPMPVLIKDIDANSRIVTQWPDRHQPETKRDRFLRLAPRRVQIALDALERVGRLSLPEYEYNENEMTRIIAALRDRLEEVECQLARKKPQKKVFSFE